MWSYSTIPWFFVDKNIFCPTTAAARGRAYLDEQGIFLPRMACENTIAARRGCIRLLKLAKALNLDTQKALEYGFMTPTNKPIAQMALIRAWNKSAK
jgi:hypothetical protein